MTDPTGEHISNILVQAFGPVKGECVVYLWDIVKVYAEGRLDIKGDAGRILWLIRNSYHLRGVTMITCTVISSDSAPVYVEANNSMATRVPVDEPGIGVRRCKGHLEHLCTRDALDASPFGVSELLRLAHSSTTKSDVRTHWFKELQILAGLKSLKLKVPMFYRWLSHLRCLKALLRRWLVVKKVCEIEMAQAVANPRNIARPRAAGVKANDLHAMLSDPLIEVQCVFAMHCVTISSNFNLFFQRVESSIWENYEKVIEMYQDLTMMYMKPEYLFGEGSDITTIDPMQRRIFDKS
ncbi:hypothetical protein QAD02_007885 [Eretmocerus hayati]|uniref:Uncharacterized protein n=1 Tax=Eretmocerus hayati TaxID=131215 RepID=A0ACC2N5J6_9HYME|nr:hypothetical protein QAD02_007885 [Eretmocerus hayati]